MAERNYRRDDNIRQTGRYAYIDGSTVRKLQTRPVPEKRETERRQEQPRRRKRTSAKTRRNRARALQMHLRDVISWNCRNDRGCFMHQLSSETGIEYILS